MVHNEDGVAALAVGEAVDAVWVAAFDWFVRCLRGYGRSTCTGLLTGLCCISV